MVTLFSKGTYFSFTVLQCTRGICQSLSCKIINYGFMYKKYLKIMSTTHTHKSTCLHVRHYCWIGPFWRPPPDLLCRASPTLDLWPIRKGRQMEAFVKHPLNISKLLHYIKHFSTEGTCVDKLTILPYIRLFCSMFFSTNSSLKLCIRSQRVNFSGNYKWELKSLLHVFAKLCQIYAIALNLLLWCINQNVDHA